MARRHYRKNESEAVQELQRMYESYCRLKAEGLRSADGVLQSIEMKSYAMATRREWPDPADHGFISFCMESSWKWLSPQDMFRVMAQVARLEGHRSPAHARFVYAFCLCLEQVIPEGMGWFSLKNTMESIKADMLANKFLTGDELVEYLNGAMRRAILFSKTKEGSKEEYFIKSIFGQLWSIFDDSPVEVNVEYFFKEFDIQIDRFKPVLNTIRPPVAGMPFP